MAMGNKLAFSAAAAFVFSIVLYAANIVFGALNLDEGWYLYAAKSFASGLRPYRDFFFTQAPALPAVYGFLSPLWTWQGVLGGRVLTAVIGLLAAALTGFATASVVPRRNRVAAAITAFVLLACNVYHTYFTAIPKTYSLASLFLAAGFLALGNPSCDRPGFVKAVRAVLCGFFLALAACTRLSLGAVLAVTGLALLFAYRRCGIAWFWFGLGGIAGLSLGLLPFAMESADAFAFANFFHGGRASGGLVFAAGSLSRLARNYMPVLLLVTAAFSLPLFGFRRTQPLPIAPIIWLVAFAAAFAVHLLSPFPYDDYQVPIMPIFVAAVSACFWSVCDFDERTSGKIVSVILALSVVFAGTSPMNESWFVVRKDRFWVETKKMPDIFLLREVGKRISWAVPVDKPLLTQDVYLAVEADRKVPAGFEMGPFGFFPSLSDEEAARYHVLNGKIAKETISASEAPIAAFSGYGFSMAAPAMDRIDAERKALLEHIESRYVLSEEVADFGQEHTTLMVYRSKDD